MQGKFHSDGGRWGDGGDRNCDKKGEEIFSFR